MNFSTLILNSIETTNDLIRSSKFTDDDIRVDYFKLNSSILTNYFRGYALIDLVEKIQTDKLAFDLKIKNDIIKIWEFFLNKPQYDSYINNLNRRFFLDIFSNFEFSLTTFCDIVIDSNQKKELLQWKLNEILSKFKGFDLGNFEEKLEKALSLKHISQVPINKKFNTLFKIGKVNYLRNITDDKIFLDLLQNLRNSHHSNFNYFGIDKDYYFGSAHYVFENNKSFKRGHIENDETQVDFNLLEIQENLKLVEEIQKIWLELTKSINYNEMINYIKP